MKKCFLLLCFFLLSIQSNQAQSNFTYDQAGNRIQRYQTPAPDLSPSQLLSSVQVGQGQTIDLVVAIRNVGPIATSGEVKFFVTNYMVSAGLSVVVNTDPTVTIGGTTYPLNTADFNTTSNFAAISLTSVAGPAGIIASGGRKIVAFRISRLAGSGAGTVTNTITIPDGTGGGEVPWYNNYISNTITKP